MPFSRSDFTSRLSHFAGVDKARSKSPIAGITHTHTADIQQVDTGWASSTTGLAAP